MRKKATTKKRASARGKQNESWPPMPPVKPKTKDKKFSQRIWNKVRSDDSLRLFAIDLNFIKRKRPQTMWRIMAKALRRCDLCTEATTRFPGLDIYLPQAVYYFSYCIQTMTPPRKPHKGDARMKAVFAFEIARRVFHSILMQEGQDTARVQRTYDAYSEMYGFKQGKRTVFNIGYASYLEPEQVEYKSEKEQREAELMRLREELNERMDESEVYEEGAIFRLKQKIHDLEYQLDTDEWPDEIDG